ncbi:S-adenosyl-L-methionine-dependent methyltransferase [Viridothelium virens]|uniref:S-adenosyl-L-methionine-dependent methyltransferase n=1 Tax=Viridothelium virens TaxID=1048519 RepID=A0A6A6HPB7_VIRVR|nr:S-adenosyl-L-methionine-dependent methyltransferase [Viridothelium virens]
MAAPNNFSGTTYEHDPRWTKVDQYTFSHLHPTSHPTNPALSHALANSQKNNLPDISAYPNLARFLALQCRAARATTALEVGTLGGYTAIWLATLNPSLRVTSVEVNPHHAAVARENIAYAGLSERIEVLEGAGVEVLPRLREEVKAGKRPRFAFAFVDADKENNWTYVQEWVEMAESGACVIVDNVVRRGKLVDPEKMEETAVMGARRLVEEVGKDPRLEGVVMQTVAEKNYDGFLMAVVN